MKHEKSEQIKALIDSGFTDEQIVSMMTGTAFKEVRAIRGEAATKDTTGQDHKRGPKVQLDEEMFNKAKKMHSEGKTVVKPVLKEVHKETIKPAISQELIEIRSVADSLARIAEALESIKELQVYKKRGLFHK